MRHVTVLVGILVGSLSAWFPDRAPAQLFGLDHGGSGANVVAEGEGSFAAPFGTTYSPVEPARREGWVSDLLQCGTDRASDERYPVDRVILEVFEHWDGQGTLPGPIPAERILRLRPRLRAVLMGVAARDAAAVDCLRTWRDRRERAVLRDLEDAAPRRRAELLSHLQLLEVVGEELDRLAEGAAS